MIVTMPLEPLEPVDDVEVEAPLELEPLLEPHAQSTRKDAKKSR